MLDGDFMKSVALSLLILILIAAVALVLAARSSRRAAARAAEPVDGRLAACPDSPNCVSSQAERGSARVEAFELGRDPAADFRLLVELLGSEPGIQLERELDGYAHLTCRSGLFGFVDDLELALDEQAGVAHVRSASRVGHSDLGANRARVEGLQVRWQARGGAR